MHKEGYIYILTNKNNTTLYVGVTADLKKRINEHRIKIDTRSFSAKYNLDKLVYFEKWNSMNAAITREKQIKGDSRNKKEE